MIRILHVTDPHLGRPAIPRVREALLAAAREVAPDAVVVTGDLVEGFDLGAWAEAEAFLGALPRPLVCVPGNHDLALFNPLARLVAPWRRYRRHVAALLDPAPLALSGATVVGLSSARRWAIDLGTLSARQVRSAHDAFARSAPGTLRVVAMHHGLRQLPFTPLRNSLYGARRIEQALHDAEVDLVLTGHNHFPHTEVLRGPCGRPLMWSQGGTACSRRFRNPAYQRCSFSAIDVLPDAIEIAWHACGPDGDAFALERRERFARGPGAPRAGSVAGAGAQGPEGGGDNPAGMRALPAAESCPASAAAAPAMVD